MKKDLDKVLREFFEEFPGKALQFSDDEFFGVTVAVGDLNGAEFREITHTHLDFGRDFPRSNSGESFTGAVRGLWYALAEGEVAFDEEATEQMRQTLAPARPMIRRPDPAQVAGFAALRRAVSVARELEGYRRGVIGAHNDHNWAEQREADAIRRALRRAIDSPKADRQ